MSTINLLFLQYLFFLIFPAYSLNCITLQSAMSGTTSNAITSITCPPTYTMVSCGYRTQKTGDKTIRGSYIINQTCYAMNGGGSNSDGVYAYARCCQSPQYSLSCSTYISKFSNAADDAKINVTCQQSIETLFGCTAQANAGNIIDGAFPGTFPDNSNNKGNPQSGTYNSYGNTCSGWMSNSGSEGVQSFGTCCNSNDMAFSCLAIISNESVSGQGATISLSCPIDYFMTGCSATSPWHEQNQWFVTNGSECYVRTGGGNAGLKAHALCCKALTLSPTNEPTINPTINPTFYPTINPTLIPTVVPTLFPTNNPTIYPTIVPSGTPTLYPSNVPTKSPTLYPSPIPTKSPTKTPLNSGEIGLSTTAISNSDNEIKSDENRNDSMIQLYIFIVSGLVLIVIVLCILLCWKRKQREKKMLSKQTGSIERIGSVSNNNTIGEDKLNIILATTPTNDNTLNEGGTEMISVPPNNANNDILNESDGSESGDLYNKTITTPTAGNDGVTAGYLENPIYDANDDTDLIDRSDESVASDHSDIDDNDKLYISGGGITTKGDL